MELKDYQNGVLDKLDYYFKKLADTKEEAEDFVAFQKMKGKEARLTDYAKDTWEALVQERRIDLLKDKSGHLVPAPYVTRFDGLERPIPNVCLKVPTGGGKPYLALRRLSVCKPTCLHNKPVWCSGWCRRMPFTSKPGNSWLIVNIRIGKCLNVLRVGG